VCVWVWVWVCVCVRVFVCPEDYKALKRDKKH